MGTIYALEGSVEEVRRQLIPKMYTIRLVADNGVVEFDAHSDLILYKEGERLRLTLHDDEPEYSGDDYVVRAYLASIRDEDNVNRYLFSAGGLLFMLETRERLPLRPMDIVYIKVSRTK